MEKISILSQLVVGVSVLIIWTFRRDNITNLTVYVEWTGSIKGSGGKGGGKLS